MLPQRIVILGVLCLAAMISQFYRAANSILAAPVMADLGLTPAAYGSMTATFFFAFMLTQLPAGMFFDRYGPRLTISGFMLFAVAGGLLFAFGNSFLALTIARILLGIGCATIVMGAFMVISFWFAPRNFAVMSSIIIATSHLGNLMGTAPLAYAVEQVGWRASIATLASLTLVIGALVFLIVRDGPRSAPAKRTPGGWLDTLKGLRRVLAMRDIQRAFVLALVCYPSMITILGLWGGPYLQTAFGLTSLEVGKVLMVMPIGGLLGALCFGPLDQLFNSRKAAVLTGVIPLGMLLLALSFHPEPSLRLVMLLLGSIAFFSATGMLIIAHGRGLVPDHLAGRAITTINVGVIGGAAFFQFASSLLLDFFIGADGSVRLSGFRLLFALMGGLVLAAVLIYLPARDVHPRQLTRAGAAD